MPLVLLPTQLAKNQRRTIANTDSADQSQQRPAARREKSRPKTAHEATEQVIGRSPEELIAFVQLFRLYHTN